MPQPPHLGASPQVPLEKGTFLAQRGPEPGSREFKTAGDSTPCLSSEAGLVKPFRGPDLPENFPLQGDPQARICTAQQIPAAGWCEGRVVGASQQGWAGGRASAPRGKVLWRGPPRPSLLTPAQSPSPRWSCQTPPSQTHSSPQRQSPGPPGCGQGSLGAPREAGSGAG